MKMKIILIMKKKNRIKRNNEINKYKKEIQELKKQMKMKSILMMKKKNRIKRNNEINKYKKEIQEIKEKLNNKDDTTEIKNNDYENKEEETYDDIPYLQTEEEAAEKIADFHEKKGKGYVDLPILLSKLNINSSKGLRSNLKQLVKNLYDNKQITKQAYNILNKAITYKYDS